ncbi:MAG: ribosome small subunit-dependent GTPase A [Clostridia bacterium]|nr:ribosome small subunit-dependent GTPase A [Clostridia bacterium]
MTGIIIKALSGFYYVKTDTEIYTCKARGSFRKSGVSPLVGDRVEFSPMDDFTGTVESILPRKTQLKRPPVANIDKLFILSSFENPAPNTSVIDKLTVLARHAGIEPIIVFNKSDMGDFGEFERIYKNAGFKTFVLSALKGEGIEELKAELKDSISAFTGNSGVGKSSVLNAVLGEDVIATGDVSQKLGRGRHTTRHSEIYPLSFGGFVADTPGFSSIESGDDYSLKENLVNCFWDFDDFKDDCRFASCSHTKEKDCAVINAVENGEIEESRWQSYLEIYEELKDLKDWQNKEKQRNK